MKCFDFWLTEETIEEALELLRKSKGKKVLIAVENLEEDDVNVAFVTKLKNECEEIIQEAGTVASVCDEFINQLKIFTEKQKDLAHIEPHGYLKTILLN